MQIKGGYGEKRAYMRVWANRVWLRALTFVCVFKGCVEYVEFKIQFCV